MPTEPVTVPAITLNNAVGMPQLGFGVWQVPDGEAEKAVTTALQAGYRSIDTAKLYDNEAGVGRALRACGLPREQVFVTTKLWNTDHDTALAAFEQSLERLGLDYLDLYLIHWPVPSQDRYIQAWRALEQLYRDGRVKAIGVSNFTIATLTRLLDETDIVPAVNQIELHPRFAQPELRAFHAEHGIITEAWSPLGQPSVWNAISARPPLDDPEVLRIASQHDRTPAQVILRWHVQLGNVVIPRSVTPARITQNIRVFDFCLTAEDLTALGTLHTGQRLGPDPATLDWMG